MPTPIPADDAGIARAITLLAQGGLVAFPTETVYGLGADATNEPAVRRIFSAKGRPADHPLIVHLADVAQLPDWALDVPPAAAALAKRFWPGALTLILRRAPRVLDVVTGGQDTVGLRIPSHPVAMRLLAGFARGVAAPSANRFGRVSPTTAAHVAADLGDDVDLILDGGATDVGIESTIIDCSRGRPVLLRPGGISVDRIEAALGQSIGQRDADAPRVSGSLASHYAPLTPVSLVASDALCRAVAAAADRGTVAVIARSQARPDELDRHRVHWCALPDEPARYAHLLYATLRRLDALGSTLMIIEAPPPRVEWDGVADRLKRAAHR